MLCIHFTILFFLSFALCSPHTHKNKAGSKETVEHGNYVPLGSHHYKNEEHDNEFDHESVLGSHSAVEEFNHLPPEEAKKRLLSLALKMDSDGDKNVDKKELVNWVLRSFKLLTEEEAMDYFEDEDEDEDGKVTWEEHLGETGLYDDDDMDMNPEFLSENLQMLEYDRKLFTAADLNEDKMLDKSEYRAFSHPEEFEHMHQVLYEDALRKQDVNKDGFLSFDEFISTDMMKTAPDPTSKQHQELKEVFENKIDLNGDNKLNKEELMLWRIPNNVQTAESEADHLIETSDSDNDGKLSIQEIVDHHDIFVGSTATGFGDQLQRYSDEL